MNWELLPYQGVGPLRLLWKSEDFRNVLGAPEKSFKRNPDDVAETDVFRGSSIFVSYDSDGLCEAIEVTSPTRPTLMGMELLGVPFVTLIDRLKQADADVVLKRTGILSHKFGVSLYAPHCVKQPHDPVEAVMVFKKGYW